MSSISRPATANQLRMFGPRRLLIRAFRVLEWPEITTPARKYLAFRATTRIWLLGRSGALRALMPGSPVKSSVSFTGSKFYKALLVVGRHADGYTTRHQAYMDLELAMQGKLNEEAPTS